MYLMLVKIFGMLILADFVSLFLFFDNGCLEKIIGAKVEM